MASNNPPESQSKQQVGPEPHELDMIANFMDNILNNMKSHIQNIQKNKNNDSSSIYSDFQNLLRTDEKEMTTDLPKPKLGPTNKIHDLVMSTTKTDSSKRNETNSAHRKNVFTKNRSPSQVTQKKLNKFPPKQNNTKNGQSRQNSVQSKNGTSKMQVVYQENDKFVSRSLSAMLKYTNGPQIQTISNTSSKRPTTTSQTSGRNNKFRSRSPSKTDNKHINDSRQRSRSFAKPPNVILNFPQQTTRSKSIISNISRKTSKLMHPSLYTNSKNAQEKKIRRSSHTLRPINFKSERPDSPYGKTRAMSLNPKPNMTKISGTQNRNIQNANVNKKPARQPQVKQLGTNSKQIGIINRFNFQNRKKPNLNQAPEPQQKKSALLDNKPPVVQNFSIPTFVKPPGIFKFMKNPNPRIASVSSDKPDENKKDDKDKGKENEMGDTPAKLINAKIQDVITMIKEEKEASKGTEVEASKKIITTVVSKTRHTKLVTPTVPNQTNYMQPSVTTQHNFQKSYTNDQLYIQKPNLLNPQNFKRPTRKFSSTDRQLSRPSIHSTLTARTQALCIPVKRKISVLTPMEIIQDYVNMVNRAKRDRKTFTICGNFYSLRRAFAERGWIEKLRVNLVDDAQSWRKLETLSNFELIEGIKDKENGDKYRRVFLSKLLAGHQVDFYWDYMTNPFSVNNDKIKRTLINRFPFGSTRAYTSKAGLCETLKEAFWYYIEGYANILFPRTYNLAFDEEIASFIEDFRRTAVISLLQWISNNADKPDSIISPSGLVPTSVFNFATLQCYNILKLKEHKDIDEVVPVAKEYEWDIFLEKFYKIAHHGGHFRETANITAPLMIDQSRYILNKLKKYLPHITNDGNMNLWLLKPNNGSRGLGIHVCRTLKYTLDTIRSRKDTKYVIQKYLERPLLIHNTKFDIRQWFLITCTPSLEVWLYKDCYLRFSSQMYDLKKLHESIHLTNNSIQCRYKNNTNRSNALPDQNMWHSDTFRRYLSDIGQPYAWRNHIYKGIKECLVGLFMLCQDKFITRVNSFELCGADFMVSEDYRPYLIEINSRPALYPSTRITATMCPKVLEDVVRVTVDYARNPRASTGSFELIYKDTFNYIPPKNINTISLEGMSYTQYIKESKEKPITETTQKIIVKEDDKTSNSIQQILNIDPNKVRKDVKNTLEKILAIIHTEQTKPEEKPQSDERSKQFRLMLTEFVDIISNSKPKAE